MQITIQKNTESKNVLIAGLEFISHKWARKMKSKTAASEIEFITECMAMHSATAGYLQRQDRGHGDVTLVA